MIKYSHDLYGGECFLSLVSGDGEGSVKIRDDLEVAICLRLINPWMIKLREEKRIGGTFFEVKIVLVYNFFTYIGST